ncbi:AraC family transcriptional regulator [Nonomuraea longicatena]|uniref:HTH araC/xylS-type domain-containing protein n=1 Tax=Nonomuraea longicatena TaxID=83682 RepID=A0ABN1PW43_9ACTN
MTYAVAALVDLDDYVATVRAQGQPWAQGQVRRVARAVAEATAVRPGATWRPEPPEEWLMLLVGTDPDTLATEAATLAEEVRARIVAETAWTATVSIGPPAAGAVEAEREARRANDFKLVLGGDRVIEAVPAGWTGGPPLRIEQELTRRVRAGDRTGAAGLLASWVDRCAREPGVDPRTLRNWLVGQLLFVVDVAGQARLADGSTDWVETSNRLPIEDIVTIGDIHERSHLHIWLKETLGRVMPVPPRRDILALAEAYLADHYTDPGLRLADVASAVCASPFYISHLFAEERGTTFLRHLTGLRLRHARRLLTTSVLPVDTIAASTGYPSAKALRIAFRRHVGCSPTEYRRTRFRTGP